jgi:protein-L-isoaspartate(D-aspartate) O-methyltransferase
MTAQDGTGGAAPADSALLAQARRTMVREQIACRGVTDPRVLEAMGAVPRHLFLEPGQQALAHADQPLPIGHGQTISQPYIVALMAQSLALRPGDRVLEVGSGCGYMAAVLSRLAGEVRGVELEPELHARAEATLRRLGCSGVRLKCGDGALGWPEEAPFDAILFSCAATGMPEEPWKQLKQGGRLVLPLGAPGDIQELVLVEKHLHGSKVQHLLPVAFVPLRRPS